jgi:putative ABC transport system ATP-binding protein
VHRGMENPVQPGRPRGTVPALLRYVSRRPVIDLERVSKTYGDGATRVEAFVAIDLHIPAGQFVSIMGPSGSGKSTLLNLVSALDVPSDGRIHIDGQDIGTLDDDALTLFRRRKMGLIFQFFNLLPTLNAADNVLLAVMLERKAPRTTAIGRSPCSATSASPGAPTTAFTSSPAARCSGWPSRARSSSNLA